MSLQRFASYPFVLLMVTTCSTAAQGTAECEPPCADTVVPHTAAIERPITTVAAVEDLQSAFKRAISRAAPAVVSIYSTQEIAATQGAPFGGGHPLRDFFGRPGPQGPRQQRGLGSGLILDGEGHILTNNHVVENADEIRIKLDDDRELEATVVGTDPPTDLALLKVDATDLPFLEVGDSDALEVGDWVLAIGSPFGLPRTVSGGIVSAKGRSNVGIVDYEDFIQTDAAVNMGNSGGPLIDLNGRVIGINTAIASRSGSNAGIAFAIPINMAKTVIEQLRGDGRVIRGHLGVAISELSPEMAESFDFHAAAGILVQDVVDGSAAHQAGVKNGDIITALDGAPVKKIASFRTDVAAQPPGATVKVDVWRDGKSQTLSVTLGEAPGQIAATKDGSGKQPKIGIRLQDLTPQLRRKLSIEDGRPGVVVAQVAPGTPAARGGIRAGDILEQVGATPVASASQAVKALREADLKRGIRLRLSRNGSGRFALIRAK